MKESRPTDVPGYKEKLSALDELAQLSQELGLYDDDEAYRRIQERRSRCQTYVTVEEARAIVADMARWCNLQPLGEIAEIMGYPIMVPTTISLAQGDEHGASGTGGADDD